MENKTTELEEREREENREIFAELQRRRNEVIEGKVTCISVDEFFKQVRGGLNR